MNRTSLVRNAATTLTRDRYVQAFVALLLLEAVFYVSGIGGPALRETVGRAFFLVPFLLVLCAGVFAGIGRVDDQVERGFWRLVAVTCVFWFVTQVGYTIVDDADPGVLAWVVLDSLEVTRFFLLLLAVEWRPRDGELRAPWDADRWVHVTAAALVTLGWFAYFVVVPSVMGSPYSQASVPTYLLFVILDLTLAGAFAVAARRSRSIRLRALYGAFAVGCSASVVIGWFDLMWATGVLGWHDGDLTDFLWVAPAGLFLVAVRLRHVPFARERHGQLEPHDYSLGERARSGATVLTGAFSFPLVHLWVQPLLPPRGPAIAQAQGIVVLVVLSALGVLAVAMYRLLGGSHRRLADSQQLLFERFRESQRMEAVGQLAGGVAHDFNNILTGIVGYNDMALQALPSDDPNRPALEQIAASAHRASELTQQLLALSRRQILKPEVIDINGLLRPLVPVLTRTLGEHVRVETRLADGLPPVLVDPTQVRTIVLTLAANARDAMPGGGTITLATRAITSRSFLPEPSARRAGGLVELTVQDTGPHIPLADQLHLFEPFYTPGSKGRGAGLSLAAVQGAVTQSGGTIDIRSEPHQGAIFAVRLPVAPADGRTRLQ